MEISISTLSDVSHVSRWSDILNHVFISAVEAANNERAQERKKEKKKGASSRACRGTIEHVRRRFFLRQPINT